jgi:uncharacterized membrane protein
MVNAVGVAVRRLRLHHIGDVAQRCGCRRPPRSGATDCRNDQPARIHPMDDRLLMIALRLVHIVFALFWVGAMVVLAGFFYPTTREAPEGGGVLQHLMMRTRLSTRLSAAAILTLLSGLWMYGRVASATNGAWMRSRPGIALGVGGLLAITAAALGGGIARPTGRRLGAVGARLQQGGGPPQAADLAELQQLQARLIGVSRIVAVLLVLAAAAMAVARYL